MRKVGIFLGAMLIAVMFLPASSAFIHPVDFKDMYYTTPDRYALVCWCKN